MPHPNVMENIFCPQNTFAQARQKRLRMHGVEDKARGSYEHTIESKCMHFCTWQFCCLSAHLFCCFVHESRNSACIIKILALTNRRRSFQIELSTANYFQRKFDMILCPERGRNNEATTMDEFTIILLFHRCISFHSYLARALELNPQLGVFTILLLVFFSFTRNFLVGNFMRKIERAHNLLLQVFFG